MTDHSADEETTDEGGGGFACVLHREPLVLISWTATGFELGALSVSDAFRKQAVTVLLLPTWTLETGNGERLAQHICRHRAFNLQHSIVPVVNTPGEVESLSRSGVDCHLINANCLLEDHVFKPLPDVEPQFDAIYNATLLRWKRHELAREVSSLALLTYMYGDKEQNREVLKRIRRNNPDAVFLNPADGDEFQRLSGHDVNAAYARCRVGLSLSAVEGAQRAAIEYLLAGLPVVSTRSIGGRDYFFDDEICIVTDDDPRQIRDAVSTLVDRNIPREYVRQRIMAKIEKEREKFIALLASLIDREAGGPHARDIFESQLAKGFFSWHQPLSEFVRQEEKLLFQAAREARQQYSQSDKADTLPAEF